MAQLLRQLGHAICYERALTIARSLAGGAPILIGTSINAQEEVETLDAEIVVTQKSSVEQQILVPLMLHGT
jgi:hypothetical protein